MRGEIFEFQIEPSDCFNKMFDNLFELHYRTYDNEFEGTFVGAKSRDGRKFNVTEFPDFYQTY